MLLLPSFLFRTIAFDLELYFKCQKSLLEQVSNFPNGEISHFAMKHFLYVFIAENEFGASELHH